jgi:hypothetical protein
MLDSFKAFLVSCSLAGKYGENTQLSFFFFFHENCLLFKRKEGK